MQGKTQVRLIGIACSSHDVLLAPFCLKACILGEPELAARVSVRVDHYDHILPHELVRRCDAICASIEADPPDYLGLSVYTWNRRAVAYITNRISYTCGRATRIVWGGPEISANDIQLGVYDRSDADMLIVGEGEIPFRMLVGGVLIEHIPRLAYKYYGRMVGSRLSDPNLATLPELYGYPSPYLMGFVPTKLLLQPGIEAVIETQRGCTRRCAYCKYHANFPRIRYRRVTDVLDEIDYIHATGCQRLRFADGNFLSNKDHAVNILRGMIHRGIKMELMFEALPTHVDEDTALAIAEYREFSRMDVTVGIGLQTMNQPTAKVIRRNLPMAKFQNAYRLLSLSDVTVKTDIILGLPLENVVTFQGMLDEIADLMRKGNNYLIVSVLMVLTDTDMEKLAIKHGLTLEGGAERFVYETPTLPRRDMVECLRLSAVAYRLFSTMRCRDAFFRSADALGLRPIQMMRRMVKYLVAEFPYTEFADQDFPNAEHWWCFEMPKLVTDDVLLEAIRGRHD